tara:strand:+ start:51 stop:659 length:609 start_codon:yes stop_codon:yes gene_type:complete
MVMTIEDHKLIRELKNNGVVLHRKTELKKLASTLADVRAGKYGDTQDIQDIKDITNIEMNKDEHSEASEAANAAAANSKRETSYQKAMRLVRVVVTPNDPLISSYPGLIFTVNVPGINNGKMIKQFVSFNNEEGWYVLQVILNQIESAEMQKFKTITTPSGEKVLEPYLTKKFNVRVLDPLTTEQMKALAASQQAAGFNVGV